MQIVCFKNVLDLDYKTKIELTFKSRKMGKAISLLYDVTDNLYDKYYPKNR